MFCKILGECFAGKIEIFAIFASLKAEFHARSQYHHTGI